MIYCIAIYDNRVSGRAMWRLWILSLQLLKNALLAVGGVGSKDLTDTNTYYTFHSMYVRCYVCVRSLCTFYYVCLFKGVFTTPSHMIFDSLSLHCLPRGISATD